MNIFLTGQIFKLIWRLQVLSIVSSTGGIPTEQYTYRAYHEIKDLCRRHKIIPDVISDAPEHKIEIAFNGENVDSVDFGNYLTIDKIQNEPKLIRWPTLPTLLYTLMFISPDYPTRENPEGKEWQYWLVTNIHRADLEMAQTFTEYSPPTIIKGKAPHRMVFLAFLQRTRHIVNFTEPMFGKEVICEERAHFSVRKFTEKYNFADLVAMNFFLMKPQNTTKLKR